MNKTYFSLPYTLQFILVNVFGITIRKSRYSKDFYKALEEYRKLDREETQKLKINEIIDVVKDSPFYSIKSEEDFINYPIMTKDDVKKHYDQIINSKYVAKYFHTSGTTGSGLKYPVCKNFLARQFAVFWKFRYLHNLKTDTWCAYLIGKNILNTERKKPPYWIKSYPTYQLLLSNSHLNKNTVRLYLKKIQENKIKWMHGYPSSLNYMACLIQECGLEAEAKNLKLDIITTSSETLFDFQKRFIEEIFGCKVRQLYGLTEGVANIFECEEGNLHVDESFSYVEFIKEEGNCEDYKIVGTNYINRAFPLIRYDTGDTVKLYNNGYTCKCGRHSRLVKEIIGREQDYIVLEDGTKIGGSGFFFKKVVNVKRAQIHQKKKGEATFYIIKNHGYTKEEEDALIEEIETKLGKNFRYTIQYTNDLIRQKNGKTKFVINDIENESQLEYEKKLKEQVLKNDENGKSDEPSGAFWKNTLQ